MALITQASEEELTQLKAKAEIDVDSLINMYHQVSSLFRVASNSWTPTNVCTACETWFVPSVAILFMVT